MDPFWYLCFVFVFLIQSYPFPNSALGQVWYLLVSIPDLCHLSYFGVSSMGRFAGPRSAVGNVSVWLQIQGSEVRSRSGPILSWRLIMKWFLRSFSSIPLIHSRRVVASYKRKYVHELLVNRLLKSAQEKSVVMWTDRPAMTIAVYLGRKATNKQTNNGPISLALNIRVLRSFSFD